MVIFLRGLFTEKSMAVKKMNDQMSKKKRIKLQCPTNLRDSYLIMYHSKSVNEQKKLNQ